MTATQITESLYIGDILDVRQGKTSDFDHIVTVCQDNVQANVSGDYDFFCLSDGPAKQMGHNPGEYSYELLSEAIGTVVDSLREGNTILVHCHAGQSRSATVCVAALAIYEDISWDESFNRLRTARPSINPVPELISDGKKYVQEQKEAT